MPIIIWNETFRVGIDILDEQHKKLIEYVNLFYDNLYAQKCPDILIPMLSNLYDYTYYHFKIEEKILLQNNHPNIVEHTNDHNTILSTLDSYRCKLSTGSLKLSIEMINYFKNTFILHIITSDKSHTEYLMNRDS